MKGTVIYVSKTGNTKATGEKIAEGMMAEGLEAKAFSYDAIDKEWVAASDVVVIGTPTYYTGASAETVTFLETLGSYGVAGKLGGAFATAAYAWGGNEVAMINILLHEMICGMVVYSGGGTQGDPTIHIGPVAINGVDYDWDGAAVLYGQRMAKKAKELFG